MELLAPNTRPVRRIILGCLECPVDLPLAEVERLERSRGKRGIGWHFLVFSDRIEIGRALDLPGNHTTGYNTDSIGIGIVGGQGANKRFGNWYAPGQKDRAIQFAKDYAAAIQVPICLQSELIKTQCPHIQGPIC